MNARAAQLLSTPDDRPQGTLPAVLMGTLTSSVLVREDGCVVLSDLTPNHAAFGVDAFGDETGVECFINHLHLDDYVALTGERHALSVGVAAARVLLAHLDAALPSRAFRVLLSVDGNVASLRFHERRSGQAWLQDDLDAYDEAIVVLDGIEEWT